LFATRQKLARQVAPKEPIATENDMLHRAFLRAAVDEGKQIRRAKLIFNERRAAFLHTLFNRHSSNDRQFLPSE
jgi:hypothetical protein